MWISLDVGPDAYKDKERYPDGPWCKKGSWVIFARYAGSRMKIDGGEVRLLNDDEVLATVENPEDIFHEILTIGRNYAKRTGQRRRRKNRESN